MRSCCVQTVSPGYLARQRTSLSFYPTPKYVRDVLERDTPSHFSDADFVFDLAILRCFCPLRTEYESCHSLTSTLDDILHKYQHLTHMDQHMAWLSRVESVAISQVPEKRLFSLLDAGAQLELPDANALCESRTMQVLARTL